MKPRNGCHCHDVPGELHQFNQIMEESASSSEDEDAPTDEHYVTVDGPNLQHAVIQYSQVNEEMIEPLRPHKI